MENVPKLAKSIQSSALRLAGNRTMNGESQSPERRSETRYLVCYGYLEAFCIGSVAFSGTGMNSFSNAPLTVS